MCAAVVTIRPAMSLGMSGKRGEHLMSRSEQASRGMALCDGLARESPMSPIPIPLALGCPAASRAAMHSATALASDLGRAAWRAGSGSGAAFAAHGVVSHFSLPPRLAHGAHDGLAAFVDVNV